MSKDKEKVLIGLKKAKSLLTKIQSMVEQDRYCIEIMQQNLAVIGLLKSVHQQLMQDHLHTCFTDGVASGSKTKQAEMIEEIVRVTKLLNKS